MVQTQAKTYQELREISQAQTEKILLLEAEVEWYRQQLGLAKLREFGPSAETTTPTQELLVFNEAEQTADPQVREVPETVLDASARRRKAVGQRKELLANLPIQEVFYRLEGEDLVCDTCRNPLHEMGTEVRQEIEVIPPQFKLIKHVRSKYCCRNCQNEGEKVVFKTAPMPKPAFPNSLASPSLVSYILCQKFVLGTPLYRQEQNLAHLGLPLSRQTLANWMLWGAQLLQPLYNRMKALLLKRDALHADETPMQVLKELGRKAQTKSYIWLYLAGRAGPPIVLYEYQETRGAQHPKTFLSGYAGYLHVDGYQSYEGLPGVTLVGCWAHVRRKFFEAVQLLPRSARDKGGTLTHIGLDFCNRLFALERQIQERLQQQSDEGNWTAQQIAEARKAERERLSKPVLAELRSWLEVQSVDTLPKTLLGGAIGYALNQWPKLIAFLEDGNLEIDNNRAERAIKPFVIGRKNWLFANTPCGAASSARIYSIVETAKQNGLNPLAYITYLFTMLPQIDTTKDDALDTLLPWNEDIQNRFNASKSPLQILP